MSTVQLPDLGEHTVALVHQAHETGEVVEIEERGVVVARVVPVLPPAARPDDLADLLNDLNDLAAEINEAWPRGVSAEDAVADVRREL